MEEAQKALAAAAAAVPFPTGWKLGFILTAIALVTFTVMLDASILATAVPFITNHFHSLLDVGWYGSAYQLASAAFQPFTGKLYAKLPLKWTYLAFFLVFELGSLLCALSTSSKMFIVSRAIAGLGSAGLLNGGLTMVSEFMPKEKAPGVIGALMSVTQLGLAFGPIIGGAFTEFVTWRWCFWLNLPIGGVVILLLAFIDMTDRTPKPKGAELRQALRESLDLMGLVLFAPAMIMLFLALQYGGNQYPWKSATVIGLFCGFGGMLAVFLLWESRRGANAMFPFAIVGQRTVWSSCLSSFFIAGVTVSGAYYLPIYFQAVEGNSPIRSGVYFLPNILPQVTFSLFTGGLIMAWGYYLPSVVSGCVLASIGYGLLTMLTPGYSIAKRVGYQIIVGVGIGSATSVPMIAVQNLIPPAEMSIAMAVLVFSLNMGASLFLQFSTVIFSQSLQSALPKYAPKVDPKIILAAGATHFRQVIPVDAIPDVLKAYSESITHVFYLLTALAAAGFVTSSLMGMKRIRKTKPAAQDSDIALENTDSAPKNSGTG
ncbi:Major facilitator superfamily domain general substrate transporter [Penicillium brevicompactum]|uniref:Major facilitator superfamily domain general substrate transporter n=1 Tax=Penicillium brevicompactum TaxID=5074 RepID=A0A9W9RD35_PENBR|nr:Major facilitator superfamily domain general substrate transporter [Penicillium brevicompactum]